MSRVADWVRGSLRTIGAVAPLASFLACSSRMDIQVIEYPDAARPAKPVLCLGEEVALFESEALVPPDCCALGDVFVGDTGFSTNCQRERVLFEVRSAACRIGANAAAVRTVTDPPSNCHQVRARLLSCPTRSKDGDTP